MDAKVVFLAYANSQSHPLPTLNKEDNDIFVHLVNRTLKGHFIIHRESFATLENINKYLGKYADRIALFHFSGHAGNGAILLDDTEANATGIAYQLKKSAEAGILKLVILNGCSTAGQVKKLLEFRVPAVIATHSPVNDFSATEFAIRFFQNLSEKGMNIKDAFGDALGPAQTASTKDLEIQSKTARHINFFDKPVENNPLWELFCLDEQSLEINPLPAIATRQLTSFVPNKLLHATLFDALYKENNAEICKIKEKEEAGDLVELADQQNAIINALPFPIGIHLQKLLCPIEDENEGYDNISLRRIEQIAELFHTTIELMGFAILSQLWELKLKAFIAQVPQDLLETLKQYFYQTAEQRATFDYLRFIIEILEYFDNLNKGEGIEYFIDELNILKSLTKGGHPFVSACHYLTDLRKQTIKTKIPETEVPTICETAEQNLCVFFENTGFLHHYNLTSIQNIDIIKPRHSVKAEFNHAVIKLMRAVGKPDKIYYKWTSYLDNQGVILLKVKGGLTLINRAKKQFQADKLEFLNLSPFVIDSNAFELNSDLSNIMFFEEYRKPGKVYTFKNVKKPNSPKDHLEIELEDKYEAIRLEFMDFQSTILNEKSEQNVWSTYGK